MKYTLSLIIALVTFGTFVAPARAQDQWTGATDNLWSTGTNWVGGVPPANGQALLFTGPGNPNNNNDIANQNHQSIVFDVGAPAFTLNGNTTGILGGGVTNNSSNTATLNFTIPLGALNGAEVEANQTWTAANGNIVLASTSVVEAAGGSFTLTIDGAHDTAFNGLVSDQPGGGGTLALVKNGTGTLTLNDGGNVYTGGTTVNAGTLVVGGNFVLGDFGPNNNLTINGGTVMTPLNAPNYYFVYNNLNANGGTMFIQTGSSVTNSLPGTSNNDYVDVFGSANLDIANSHLFVHQITGFTPNNGDRITVINTNGGVFGNFSDAPNGTVAPNDFVGLIQPFADTPLLRWICNSDLRPALLPSAKRLTKLPPARLSMTRSLRVAWLTRLTFSAMCQSTPCAMPTI